MRVSTATLSSVALLLIASLASFDVASSTYQSSPIPNFAEIVYTSPQEIWFLQEFYSGRSERVSGNYLYARTSSMANITQSGDLIRVGNVNPNRPLYGGTNWADIDQEWSGLVQSGRILILGLWINNFEKQTETSISNFLTKLNQRAENLNTYVIWLPCWEFNQQHTVDYDYYGSFWGWGTTRENKWYIEPSEFNQKMKMFRKVRDNLQADRVLLAVQVDALVRYNWDDWEGHGIMVLEQYREGANYADIAGASMYIGDYSEDVGLYDADFISLCFERMHIIRDYLDSTHTKPFFVFEYNTITAGSISTNANEFFIENSYKLVEQHYSWGLRCLSWFCPFSNSAMYDVCNYWAGVYDGYSGGG